VNDAIAQSSQHLRSNAFAHAARVVIAAAASAKAGDPQTNGADKKETLFS